MKPCKVQVNENHVKVLKEALFIGVFQVSDVIPPSGLRGGHTGGVVAYPVAVVQMNGSLRQVRISDVVMEPEVKSSTDKLFEAYLESVKKEYEEATNMDEMANAFYKSVEPELKENFRNGVKNNEN